MLHDKMKVYSAYRYELKPNPSQLVLLSKHVGTARFAWNWALDRVKKGKSAHNFMKLSKEWNVWKKDNIVWWPEISSSTPKAAFRNLDRAYKNLKKNPKFFGQPKFKKKFHHDSATFSGPYGSIKVNVNSIQLPRIGKIMSKEKTRVKGKIISATTSRIADHWFVSLTVIKEIKDLSPVVGPRVGIDLGLNSFATIASSDGTVVHVQAPKPLKTNLHKLQRLSRQHSRKQPGSNNRKKSALRLARLHYHIANIRKDFLHKLTTSLAKTKSEIVIEDLFVSNMLRNRRLARSISDVGWSEFRRQLKYKTVWYGSKLTVRDRFFPSSQLCCKCGHQQKMPLSERVFSCQSCGNKIDRDDNSSINILGVPQELTPVDSRCFKATG